MASTSLLVLSVLTWFTTDVQLEKVLDVLKGSTVVLTPDDVETLIISVTWKHGEDLAAEWFGGNPTFYRSFKDRCSLTTETGELMINDVKLEDGGVYKPEINNNILNDIKLQVFSPVPKPSISSSCNSEKTQCTLTCMFNQTDDLGDVQVFWIHDDGSVKEGRKLPITKETKEQTFICSLKNPFSSENSDKLKNPLAENNAVALILTWLFIAVCLAVLCCVIKKLLIWQRKIREISLRTMLEKEEEQRLKNYERLKMIIEESEKWAEEVETKLTFPEPKSGTHTSDVTAEINSEADSPDGIISTPETSEQVLPPDCRDLE
ncbi:hypothetical protein OJAV_G00012840 [Oryzias javanicus]|uniref:Ig-like domain-containing protein n=1 Tax=Oryzias javanicus TaxID=123683 RepID=A0A3S2UNW2_ORYJA|nr:hypothetical protein OJAV_G00012840 [Oryzias javanicus]